MDKAQFNLDFRLMSLMFKVRDVVATRMRVLEEVGIEPGFRVLDYGCGPGSYTPPLAELVGEMRSRPVPAVDDVIDLLYPQVRPFAFLRENSPRL